MMNRSQLRSTVSVNLGSSYHRPPSSAMFLNPIVYLLFRTQTHKGTSFLLVALDQLE